MNAKIQYGPARTLTFAATRGDHRRAAKATRLRLPTGRSRLVAVGIGAAAMAATALVGIPRHVPGAALVMVFGAAWLGMLLAVMLPSQPDVTRTDLSRRLGRFRHALNSAGDRPSRDALMDLLTLSHELGLRDDEIADELSQIRASLSALELRERLERGDLPVINVVTQLPPDDHCHFVCPARFGRRRADQFGHLLLTSGWLRFRGALDLSVAWSEVSSVQRSGCEVIVNLRDSAKALRFGCHTLEESARGAVTAEYLARGAGGTPLAQ